MNVGLSVREQCVAARVVASGNRGVDWYLTVRGVLHLRVGLNLGCRLAPAEEPSPTGLGLLVDLRGARGMSVSLVRNRPGLGWSVMGLRLWCRFA